MSRPVRWLTRLTILVGVIGAVGLVFTLLVHTVQAPRRARDGAPVAHRTFRPPHIVRGTPAFLKQIAIVGLIALVGRRFLKIRL